MQTDHSPLFQVPYEVALNFDPKQAEEKVA
jgi:hypothetical protein